MSITFQWCKDKTRLDIWDKHVFYFNWCGDKFWYFNGVYHRVNGPAVERNNGHKSWCLNGEYHRINGPAVEYTDGTKAWFLNGKIYSESAYWKELDK